MAKERLLSETEALTHAFFDRRRVDEAHQLLTHASGVIFSRSPRYTNKEFSKHPPGAFHSALQDQVDALNVLRASLGEEWCSQTLSGFKSKTLKPRYRKKRKGRRPH